MTENNRRRRSDSWWVRGVAIAFLFGFVGQGMLTWRTVSVVENDMRHLTAVISEMKDDIRDIWNYLRP